MTEDDLRESLVYTVSELSAAIRDLLEQNFPYVWVRGEVSNARTPASGHCYLTLKDEDAQLRAVVFKPQVRALPFRIEDGLLVLCQGRVSVFEPRGEYQLIVEHMEPAGIGALQLAFEQLKSRLAAEGLFDPARKRPLPAVPQRIAIVTSATGAAIRDMLKVFERSPFPLTVSLFPVRVQGEGAAKEIARAVTEISRAARKYRFDLAIVGRGGGSTEDLWAFNDEALARAVAACAVPVISAVGHEIDTTICDMAADLRAPTPTAAAEWVVSRLAECALALASALERLKIAASRRLADARLHVRHLAARLADPRRRFSDTRLRLDDLATRAALGLERRLERSGDALSGLETRLLSSDPARRLLASRETFQNLARRLTASIRPRLDSRRANLREAAARLDALSPLAVLARGYALCTRTRNGRLLRDARDTSPGESVAVRLLRGSLHCTVRETTWENPPPGDPRHAEKKA